VFSLPKLSNLEDFGMKMKAIASTEVQNNFGRILNDVIQNGTRYVVKRRNSPQAILLSLTDFEELLTNDSETHRMVNIVRELTPVYSLGEAIIEEDKG
jgi:PHD/YefM family antitoxin component YafN of YafNO toxin-antitoxin module